MIFHNIISLLINVMQNIYFDLIKSAFYTAYIMPNRHVSM